MEFHVRVIYRRVILVTSECRVKWVSVKPGLGYWQTVQTQIRRHRTRRLIMFCTVCLTYGKLRIKWKSFKSPFRTIFQTYTQRQLTHPPPVPSVLWLFFTDTVDSLSRIPRDSLKYFEISVLRHIRFAELRKKLIRLTTFNKYMCNWTLEVRDKLKILWKRGEIAGAISPLFHNIFLHVVRFTCLGRDQIFTSR